MQLNLYQNRTSAKLKLVSFISLYALYSFKRVGMKLSVRSAALAPFSFRAPQQPGEVRRFAVEVFAATQRRLLLLARAHDQPEHRFEKGVIAIKMFAQCSCKSNKT